MLGIAHHNPSWVILVPEYVSFLQHASREAPDETLSEAIYCVFPPSTPTVIRGISACRVGDSQWERQKRFVIYADPDSLRKNGGLVRMWELWDYALEQTYFDHPYLSLKRHAEYDCKGKRARKLSVTTYTSNMGNGTVGFHSNKEEAWNPVAPKTINEELWEYACGKKSR